VASQELVQTVRSKVLLQAQTIFLRWHLAPVKAVPLLLNRVQLGDSKGLKVSSKVGLRAHHRLVKDAKVLSHKAKVPNLKAEVSNLKASALQEQQDKHFADRRLLRPLEDPCRQGPP